MSSLKGSNAAANLARVLGEPLRLAILHRLMDGPATVNDLVATLGRAQPKVSNHLAILREHNLVEVRRKGRQAAYELRDSSVAQLVESLLSTSGTAIRAPSAPAALSLARTCYDHLAGKLGVVIFDALVRSGALVVTDQIRGGVDFGPAAEKVFERIGLDARYPANTRRKFAYGCLDWTERRPHLGGWLGARLCDRALEAGWVRRQQASRAVTLTTRGRASLAKNLAGAIDLAEFTGFD